EPLAASRPARRSPSRPPAAPAVAQPVAMAMVSAANSAAFGFSAIVGFPLVSRTPYPQPRCPGNVRKVVPGSTRPRPCQNPGRHMEKRMKEKDQIVGNWLPRYTGVPLDGFGEHILLTNFGGYLGHFARHTGATIVGTDRPMPSATADGITMINFGMGSPNAATLMDLLSAISPKAVLFLGKCGGLKRKNQLGDLILPIAAIRGEGTSDDYLPPQVPALPAFALQRAVSTSIRDAGLDYWTGTVYTTNRRVWEHDDAFKERLRAMRCMAIDMETATVFAAGFANRIPS